MTYEGLRLKFRNKIYLPLTSNYRARKLKYTNFTIISNNCWGGTIYESYNLKKMSPTVGMFFMAEDYIKFLENMRSYLESELYFIEPEDSKYKKELSSDSRWGHYPIGKLNDIELFFLHYHSKEEAKEKWSRRCKRINWDKMLVKFNDQNGCTEDLIERFTRLPYKNKICFAISDKENRQKGIYKIRSPKKYGHVMASYEPLGANRTVNINEIINELK